MVVEQIERHKPSCGPTDCPMDYEVNMDNEWCCGGVMYRMDRDNNGQLLSACCKSAFFSNSIVNYCYELTE